MGQTVSNYPVNDDHSLTPSRKPLDIDPRSPSEGFSRTPIMVEKTPPDPACILDPRSPTVGIMRTPISNVLDKMSCIPRVQTDDPLLDDSVDDSYTIDRLSPIEMLSLSETTTDVSAATDASLNIHGLCLSDSELAVTDSTHLIPEKLTNSDTTKNNKQHIVKTKKIKPREQPLPKQLFNTKEGKTVSKKSPAKNEGGRSPLRTCNPHADSPRNIIQRKQIKKLDLNIKSCGLESKDSKIASKDKENM